MRQINIPTLQDMVTHVVIRLNEPLMVWGPSGCGKTEAINEAATQAGALVCDIRVSQYEGVDFRGVPDVRTGMTVWNLPATMPFVGNPKFPTDRIIVLFFDELNSAQDDGVYAVCYQIIQERRAGEHELLPNVRIVAAGNRESDRGVTRRMPAPLSNRMTHAEAVIDPPALIMHLQRKGVPRICLGFLAYRRNLISTFDPAKPEKSVASPRTWEKAFRYYTDPHMPDSLRWTAISGAVGEGPATEFQAFASLAGKVITTRQILDDPHRAPLPKDEAQCWATTMNISGDMTPANAEPLAHYLERVAGSDKFGPEYAIAAWQLALKRDETLHGTPEFLALSRTYKEVFGG